MYQVVLEICRGLPEEHPMRDVLEAVEELRDKLFMTRPLKSQDAL